MRMPLLPRHLRNLITPLVDGEGRGRGRGRGRGGRGGGRGGREFDRHSGTGKM